MNIPEINQTLSWIAFMLTVICMILTILKMQLTWYVGLLSCVIWFAYAWNTNQTALMLCQLMFAPLNVWGIIAWKKQL